MEASACSIGLTIASSEQEAASTLGLHLETVSRCLLSLTQALGSFTRHEQRYPKSCCP
jgi:hypothetical protein